MLILIPKDLLKPLWRVSCVGFSDSQISMRYNCVQRILLFFDRPFYVNGHCSEYQITQFNTFSHRVETDSRSWHQIKQKRKKRKSKPIKHWTQKNHLVGRSPNSLTSSVVCWCSLIHYIVFVCEGRIYPASEEFAAHCPCPVHSAAWHSYSYLFDLRARTYIIVTLSHIERFTVQPTGDHLRPFAAHAHHVLDRAAIAMWMRWLSLVMSNDDISKKQNVTAQMRTFTPDSCLDINSDIDVLFCIHRGHCAYTLARAFVSNRDRAETEL